MQSLASVYINNEELKELWSKPPSSGGAIFGRGALRRPNVVISAAIFDLATTLTDTRTFSTSIVQPIEQIIDYLRGVGCKINDETVVRNFLLQNMKVIEYLYEAPAAIQRFFGGGYKLSVEIVTDLDDEQDDRTLFLIIEIYMEPKNAIKVMNSLDQEWLVNRIGADIVKFNLNLKLTDNNV